LTRNKTLLGVVLTTAALLPWPAAAENIYKFQDENGIWHFTDRAPDSEIQFEVIYMEREPEPRIRLRQEGPKENPVYIVSNDLWGPAQIELKLRDAVNVLSEPPLPARFVIPGKTEQTLVGLGALDPQRGFQYRLSVATVPGQQLPEMSNTLSARAFAATGRIRRRTANSPSTS
jgi:hypothetical protein